MSTEKNTSFSLEELEGLAAAQSGAEVSEEELTGSAEETTQSDIAAPAVMPKLNITEVDHSIFETQKLNTASKIRYSSTFDDVTLFNALNSSSESVSDYFDKDIEVQHMVVTTAQVSSDYDDELSEKEDKPCVHFFCTDGLHLASVSNGIMRSTENLITCGFMPTPESPITIRFREIKTKKGKAHTFDLVKRG